MSIIDIRRPNITDQTEAGKLEQIRSYLYYMSEQLNWAFNTIETGYSSPTANITQSAVSKAATPEETESNFNALKGLIIKSADIVNAYSEVISKKLEGVYVAESPSGNYKQETAALIEANSKSITQTYENIQRIETNFNGELESVRSQLKDTRAYIRTGEIADGVYGVEVGQSDEFNGEEFRRFASFTADKLSFYDGNRDEVAYISNYKLWITQAHIRQDLLFGDSEGYRLDTSDGIAFIWEDRGGSVWQ